NTVLLLTYFTYVFRVMFPLVDYVVNYNFIISELCEQKDEVENKCLGKCHLTKEISKQTKLPDKDNLIIKIDLLKIPHIAQREKSNSLLKEFRKTNLNQFIEKEIKLTSEPNLPPPKAIAV
ncbi:MAG: hypothetical protein OQJ81_03395, partial [Melioribacteraceae bacterium]|nr:hypothetical protein [Melioribacteraceae bacterium]